MYPTTQEVRRIRQELKEAGVTAFGRAKFASHFLPHVLHEGEHIKGVVYGRYTEGTGLLRWVEGSDSYAFVCISCIHHVIINLMTEICGNLHALTGVRPTGNLTIGNYLGAIKPIVEMQDTFSGDVSVFVADIHGLTDNEPDTIVENTLSSARSLIAAGVDPQRSTVYLQSQIENDSIWLAHMLDRHTTPAELARTPTLKDKIRDGGTADTVNMALFRYPVLMAADIAVQNATHVPVGEDQLPHIEFARQVIRRFNNTYGHGEALLTEPQELKGKAVRVAALQEKHGKMSKSEPTSALLLRDGPDVVARKIKKAQTAPPGKLPTILKSHFDMAVSLSANDAERQEIRRIEAAHVAGELVMGSFKTVWTDVVNSFLVGYRQRYDSFTDDDIKGILRAGGERAEHTTQQVVGRVKTALGFAPIL